MPWARICKKTGNGEGLECSDCRTYCNNRLVGTKARRQELKAALEATLKDDEEWQQWMEGPRAAYFQELQVFWGFSTRAINMF